MTLAKDMARPSSQHRLSGFGASSVPLRNSYSRTHSHSTSFSTAASNNRVGRRKSSTFTPTANAAALSAAVENGVADGSVAINNPRRGSVSKAALGSLNDRPSMPNSLPHHASIPERESSPGSVIIDGPTLSSMNAANKSESKMRRASDGTRLTKKEKAAAGDLKCEHCGKAYKHGSCLTKHLWEHTPQWQVTSKLLISKHQQVQLLEAASVLVAMNGESNDSDSSSPAASGSSDMREDGTSSAETTPPPQTESSYRDSKRLSNTSSAYSRSYQSVFSSESAPTAEHGFGHYRQWSASSNRPTTANTSIAESYKDEDPQDLAAAVGLLSCSYGTPNNRPTNMTGNVPPVPPLPAKYANQFTGNRRHQPDDVQMHDQDSSDEGDDGIFGKMDA
ncbi:zinc finger protein [Acrodontium crateriforme]|uniref:Zinc finger protein n=1 Tax=Acrodontium crateriforme TaxID=150365 RepID=A0AAQ3M283_9PEZI|nr:zinc finger protein [Acrodontium crateriforme]